MRDKDLLERITKWLSINAKNYMGGCRFDDAWYNTEDLIEDIRKEFGK